MNTSRTRLEARIDLVRKLLIILKFENSKAYRQAVRYLPKKERAVLNRIVKATFSGRKGSAGVSAARGTRAAARPRSKVPRKALLLPKWRQIPFKWEKIW